MVKERQIEQLNYDNMDTVHVLCGKGKNANSYEAKFIFSGMRQESLILMRFLLVPTKMSFVLYISFANASDYRCWSAITLI